MTKVLLSIKPEFAEKIFNGTKKFEFRRKIFKRRDINKALVYQTAPLSCVIGEFEISGVEHGETNNLWALTREDAGTSREKFFDYFEGLIYGYVIGIKNPKLYDKPIPLSEYGISRPPQSFMYIEVK